MKDELKSFRHSSARQSSTMRIHVYQIVKAVIIHSQIEEIDDTEPHLILQRCHDGPKVCKLFSGITVMNDWRER